MKEKKLKRGMPPLHPGKILKQMYLEPLQLTVTALANEIDLSIITVSEIINGNAGIGEDVAEKLSRKFLTTQQFWINLQRIYDQWYKHGVSDSLNMPFIALWPTGFPNKENQESPKIVVSDLTFSYKKLEEYKKKQL